MFLPRINEDHLDELMGALIVEIYEEKLWKVDKQTYELQRQVRTLSKGDILLQLWTSTTDLNVRFKNRLPTYEESVPLIQEEVKELLDEVDKLQTNSPNASKQNLVDEAVDSMVVIMNALLASGIMLDDLRAGVERVVAKNNAKTHETHCINENGKIARRKNR